MAQRNYYIKENYYFDFDNFNQLRIAGPNNYLLLGWTFPFDLQVNVLNYYMEGKQLVIDLQLETNKLELSVPAITDIRTIRSHTEGINPRPTYQELAKSDIKAIMPKQRTHKSAKDFHLLQFKNTGDNGNKTREYGVKIYIPKTVKVELKENTLSLHREKAKSIPLKIKTINRYRPIRLELSLFSSKANFKPGILDEFLLSLFDISADHIEHLIKSNKTSSFEYGTIFPRDWMESADLGNNDFKPQAIDYMYSKALEHVSEGGEGWHEDMPVNTAAERRKKKALVDRKMIDIETHYILGLNYVSPKFLLNRGIKEKLKRVAKYIVKNADEKEYITFKQVADSDNYFQVGNWRDSRDAFPGQKSPLAPYDVNCIFYPMALKTIKEYNQLFKINPKKLDALIEKWDDHKEKYRIFHPDNIVGYSIALHGLKNKPMPISHLDEAYDLFYGRPSLHEIDSFAKKILDSNYFYTPGGPILVAADEEDFSSYEYHGKVIWPKQAGFAIAGLTEQYRTGVQENWPQEILSQIKDAIIITCEACFKGWRELGYVPELYYYDYKHNRASLYTDQREYEGQMSNIQLWSSVAVRRIILDYHYIKTQTL